MHDTEELQKKINAPLVTVILLTYNQQGTIARALESILEQDTTFAFDIFVLDDCSTDNTAAICSEYQARYPDKVHVFVNKKNLGPTENYKQGLLQVKSRYHAFLEGDDYWTDRKKLQMQVDLLESEPGCTICSHKTLCRDGVGGKDYVIPDKRMPLIKSRFTRSDKCYSHASSRVYRNVIDLENVPCFMFWDTEILSLYLIKGDLLYMDRIMSVYNSTGSGYWSGKSKKRKRLLDLKQHYWSNRYLNFVCETRYYSRSQLLKLLKAVLGVRIGWFFYYYFKVLRLHLKYMFRN